MAELDKMPRLKEQFIPICIHHPQNLQAPPLIRLPMQIQECKKQGLIPILAIAGFKELIFAQSALSWIQESALKFEEGVTPSNIHGSGMADNCSTISQASRQHNSLFDTDYNLGFSSAKGEFAKGYSNIDEAVENRIITYDNKDSRKDASNKIAQRLEQMKFNRDIDVPKVPPRVGGLGNAGMMGGGVPQGLPQMPQMPQHQGMPHIPHAPSRMSMPARGGGGMPQMPQQRGMHGSMPQMPRMPRGGMPQMPRMPQQGGNPRMRYR